MKRWQRVWRVIPFLALALGLSGCGNPYLSALSPKGEVAKDQLSLMMTSIYIMAIVFVVVAIIYTFVLIKFRKRPGQNEIPEQVKGNHKLEIIWTVIPVILLVILAVPTVKQTFSLAEQQTGGDVVQVKVIAHQFWWEFQYPELGITTAQELYIPTGKKIQLALDSKDVRHSFWVPTLAGKMDNVPAVTNHMWIKADENGTYQGRCAELCGTAHAQMNFHVVAVDPDQFDKWATGLKAASASTTVTSDLAKQGQTVFQANCISCHAIGSNGGAVGPNLAGFGDRKWIGGIADNNAENLAKWIKNPQDIKIGSKMPAFDKLKQEDVNALVEYLSNLKINQ